MPHQIDDSSASFLSGGEPRPNRTPRIAGGLLGAVFAIGLCGCTSLWHGKADDGENDNQLRELMAVPPMPDAVRDAAVTHGIQPIEVDGVGAINGLSGTGGPADPSPFRDQLIEEMKRHDVADPNHVLELDSTALVRVRATIPPGARRGDPLDLRVLAPKESQASDLHGGWLLETRLRQQQVLQNMVRQSDVMAIGVGPVLTRGDYTPGDDESLRIEGNVLSGGRVQVTRKLGLILRPKYQHAKLADGIAQAVNRRYFFFDGTTRRGIAKPLEDDFIEIEVHPRYRHNIPRMMEVVRSIQAKQDSSSTQASLTRLAGRLGEPATAAAAALELEAIGENAVPTLLEGLRATNPELRFYAAEALAYLDRTEAVAPLEEAARQEPAFRHLSLLALQGIEHHLAIEALRRLIDEPSIETRYGSFCSIRRRADGKSSLNGQPLGSFWLYEVPSTAPPAVVVSLRESAEIVLLGSPAPIVIPEFMRGPGGLLITPNPANTQQLRISRFMPGQEDQRAVVSNSVASLVRGIAAVGGGYGDAIAVLRMAKAEGYYKDQLAIDPLPRAMRTYYRDQAADPSSQPTSDDE
jgi:flagellar basal body P-ring protein FlgI